MRECTDLAAYMKSALGRERRRVAGDDAVDGDRRCCAATSRYFLKGRMGGGTKSSDPKSWTVFRMRETSSQIAALKVEMVAVHFRYLANL